jgi:hypothetical protein
MRTLYERSTVVARRVPAVLASVVLVAGVASACGASGAGGGGQQQPSTAWSSDLPHVAEIVCDQDGTHLLTPVVQPQRDGLHVRIDNRSGRDLGFAHRLGGEDADPGVTEHVLTYAPGAEHMRCVEPNRQDRAADVALRIEDPLGLWVDTDLSGCGSAVGMATPDYTPDARGVRGDLEKHAAEALPSLGPSDVVERAGYPGESVRRFRAVRDGEVIGLVSFRRDGHGGWLLDSTTSCE